METQELAVRQNSNIAATRQEFGATEIQMGHETAASAVAAREAAAVQARYVMAMQRPRNVEQCRSRLLNMCLKPGFATKVEYAKPAGKKWVNGKEEAQFITGASIRFVETALQCFGNVLPQTATVFDGPRARICRVSVTDLEVNITYEMEVLIEKTVERKGYEKPKGSGKYEPPQGREIIAERLNSYGEPVFIVVATDDEITLKQNSAISKALRTQGLRILPWDIVDEAILTARQTMRDRDAKDPDAAKRELLDYFAALGVEPVDIESYLSKSISKPLLPAEIAALRKVYAAIRDGEATWADIMAQKDPEGSDELQAEIAKRKAAEYAAAVAAGTIPAMTSASATTATGSAAAATTTDTATTAAQTAPRMAEKLQFGRKQS